MYGYSYPSFRSSGSRIWGMSNSLPSGMSYYNTQYYQQDTDFAAPSYHPPTRYAPSNGTLGSIGHVPSHQQHGGHNPGTNLIVNYLPQDMHDRELYSLFRQYGPIETCRIMRDFKSNYSYGYGFVNFLTEEAAQKAIKHINGLTLRNKRLKVSFARPASEDIKETNLYVTNLPRTITEEQLDIIFGKYGTIVQKNILRDKQTGKPRGVAFVRFNKREEAQEAISALNNVIPEGSTQPLTVRLAEEHGKAKATQYYSSTATVMNHMNMNMSMMNNIGYQNVNSVMHRGRSRVRFPNICPY